PKGCWAGDTRSPVISMHFTASLHLPGENSLASITHPYLTQTFTPLELRTDYGKGHFCCGDESTTLPGDRHPDALQRVVDRHRGHVHECEVRCHRQAFCRHRQTLRRHARSVAGRVAPRGGSPRRPAQTHRRASLASCFFYGKRHPAPD